MGPTALDEPRSPLMEDAMLANALLGGGLPPEAEDHLWKAGLFYHLDDVAEAHLAEVAKYHDQMETTLRDSKKALSARQLKAVKVEYASLEKICTNVGKLVERLQAEFSKDKPGQLTIRELASELRNEMTSGYRLHEIMKKKLGLR